MIEDLFDSYESYEDEAREAEIRVGMAVPAGWKNRPYHVVQAARRRRAARSGE